MFESVDAQRAVRTNGGGLDLSGYQRPDMIGYLHEGRFGFVPGNGLDNIRYYAQALGDLARRCPALNLEAAKDDLLPYMISGASDLASRFRNGTLSSSEAMQMGWMALVAVGANKKCVWDRNGGLSYELAQRECDEASSVNLLGVLPSFAASADIELFLRRHRCESAETGQFARNLAAFGRQAPAMSRFTREMPAPDTLAGRTLVRIFDSCSRSSFGSSKHEWCGCYLRALAGVDPPQPVLDALANNPFVDGRSYLSWSDGSAKARRALSQCADQSRDADQLRLTRAPRATACLINQAPAGPGGLTCQYRAAWGEFSVTRPQCAPSITSREWGFREVDCDRGGVLAAAVAGPRRWKRGFTYIDYEQDVPAEFVASFPSDVVDEYPMAIRFLTRTAPGQLKTMSVARFVPLDADLFGQQDGDGVDLAHRAIAAERGLTLKCSYVAPQPGRVFNDVYWFDTVPRFVSERRAAPTVQPYLDRIGGARRVCPNTR